MSDDHDGCEWVTVSSGTRVVPDQRVICVCLVVHAHLLFIYIMLCTITVTSVCATETLPNQVNSALHPSRVAKSSTSFGWGKGGNVTSVGLQVTLCDPMWHVSSRSGVATLRTAIHLLLTYLPTTQPVEEEEGRITRITSGATSVFTAQGS